MKTNAPVLLLLEDSVVCATRIARALQEAFPDLRLIHARTVEEAQIVGSELGIDFFLIDVLLPDGNGFDFLCDMATVLPEAKAVIMTGEILPEYELKAQELGVLALLEKPVQPGDLVDLLRSEFFPHAADSFHASLSCVTPIDIVQMKCIGGATGAIEFEAGNRVGQIFFAKGEVVHARMEELIGEEAFYEILSWKGGSATEFLGNSRPELPTISRKWEHLLINAAKHSDDRQKIPA